MKLGNVNIDNLSMDLFVHRVWVECTLFYEDPENMKRFEEWKAKRDAEAAAKGEPS